MISRDEIRKLAEFVAEKKRGIGGQDCRTVCLAALALIEDHTKMRECLEVISTFHCGQSVISRLNDEWAEDKASDTLERLKVK